MFIYPEGRNDSAIDAYRNSPLHLYQYFDINAIDTIVHIGYGQDSIPYYVKDIYLNDGKVISPIKEYMSDRNGLVVVDGLTKDKYITLQAVPNRHMTGYNCLFNELSRENAGITIYDTISAMH